MITMAAHFQHAARRCVGADIRLFYNDACLWVPSRVVGFFFEALRGILTFDIPHINGTILMSTEEASVLKWDPTYLPYGRLRNKAIFVHTCATIMDGIDPYKIAT
jgi:hypothetical protein